MVSVFARAGHGNVGDVGEELAEPVVHRHTAVDAQVGHGNAVGLCRGKQVHRLERDALQRRGNDLVGTRVECQPRHQSACVRSPMRSPQTGESGYNEDATRVAAGAPGGGLGIGSGVDQSHLVAQPLDGHACVEDAAFDGVGGHAVHTVTDGRQQPSLGTYALRTRIGDQEAAGAVGAFGHPRREATLTDQRRLLVAGHAADWDLRAEPLGVGNPEVVDAVAH